MHPVLKNLKPVLIKIINNWALSDYIRLAHITQRKNQKSISSYSCFLRLPSAVGKYQNSIDRIWNCQLTLDAGIRKQNFDALIRFTIWLATGCMATVFSKRKTIIIDKYLPYNMFQMLWINSCVYMKHLTDTNALTTIFTIKWE